MFVCVFQVAGIWGIVPLFYAVSAAISSSPRLGMPGVMSAMLGSPAYWIALVLAVLLSVVPLAAKYVWRAGAQAQIKVGDLIHHVSKLTKTTLTGHSSRLLHHPPLMMLHVPGILTCCCTSMLLYHHQEMLHHHSLRLLRWRKGRFSPSSSLFPLATENT